MGDALVNTLSKRQSSGDLKRVRKQHTYLGEFSKAEGKGGVPETFLN